MREPRDFWRRSMAFHGSAMREADLNPDSSASSSYYSALYAISALMAMDGKLFKTHGAVEVALHREYIHPGKVPDSVGKAFQKLMAARHIGNYGLTASLTPEEARACLALLDGILADVGALLPIEVKAP